ncbi:MAG: hypothetical protein FE048_04445 [Thermoplasmata archaeon]|nr:MAG: hypothetical protein FE048_04445 [Thermoplasmata archaeon]
MFEKKYRSIFCVFLSMLIILPIQGIPTHTCSEDVKRVEERLSQSMLVGAMNGKDNPLVNLTVDNNEQEIIDEYTWAVTRYDHEQSSINFGDIGLAKPSPGTILVPTNVMSSELCKVALQIYDEDKLNILNNLVEFDEKNMKHMTSAMLPRYDEWNSPGLKSAYRKEAAHEMFCLGKGCISPFANIVGDCYALSSFNTAVLRLCGFEPEEAFNVLIVGHAVNMVNANGKWYVIDPTLSSSVRKKQVESILFENYDVSEIYGIENRIFAIENDRYFIFLGCWGVWYSDFYSNMDNVTLHNVLEGVLSVFNNPFLGSKNWEINDFIKEAKPNPDMVNVSLPYTVKNATGSSIDEKANSLSKMNYEFILKQAEPEDLPNQYSRALYAYNLINVSYPQAYANAAKYAAWTSWLGDELDADTLCKDISRTVNWVRLNIKTSQVLNKNQIAFADFPYIMRKGSTLDQAIVAYGTLRNMNKNSDFWQPKDLYVLITTDNEGYLAVNTTNGWEYLNFGFGEAISNDPPENVEFAFNEEIRIEGWLG